MLEDLQEHGEEMFMSVRKEVSGGRGIGLPLHALLRGS